MRCCIPDEGKIFIQPDQAGAEALVVAYLCNPGKFRELFINNVKSHTYVALNLFRHDWEERGYTDPSLYERNAPIPELKASPEWSGVCDCIKNDQEKYYIGKKTCHSGNYGIGPKLFRTSVIKDSEGKTVLTPKEAKFFLDSYHALFPEIREWHEEVKARVKQDKRLTNLFGYARYFYEPVDGNEKEMFAFVPQSTVGTITNLAFTNMHRYIRKHKLDWDLLNNKHDSILMQSPIAEAQDAAKILRSFMELPMRGYDGTEFKMGTGVSYGFNWGSYHKDYNPTGMKEAA